MSKARELAARYADEMRRRDAALPGAFTSAADALAAHGPARGLERRVRAAAHLVTDLAGRSPAMALAFAETLPSVLEHVAVGRLDTWAATGRAVDHGTRKSAALAARWFRGATEILPLVAMPVAERIAGIAGRLAATSLDAATTVVGEAPAVLAALDETQREPFVTLVERLAAIAWPDAVLAVERTAGMAGTIAAGERGRLLEVAALVANRPGAFARFADAVEGLSGLPGDDQGELLALAERIAAAHPEAAIEFLHSAPGLWGQLEPDQFRHWAKVGIDLLDDERYAASADAYFRLESSLAADTLALVSPRVELVQVGETLKLYAQAMTGVPVAIRSTQVLVERGLGWTTSDTAATEGQSIYLPPHVDRFDDRDANARVYKVAVTHQAGRLEFGSFDYRHGADGAIRSSTVAEREAHAPGDDRSQITTPIQRFFDLFEDRRLIGRLFAVVDDTRVDTRITEEYPGVVATRRVVHDHEAVRRPELLILGLREVFCENLLRASLGRLDLARWMELHRTTMARGLALLDEVRRPGTTVQDSAEIAAALYDIVAPIPNMSARTLNTRWVAITAKEIRAAAKGVDLEPIDIRALHALGSTRAPMPFDPPSIPDFRGELKPALVQAITAVRTTASEAGRGDAVLGADQLRDLLARAPELLAQPGNEEEAEDLDELVDHFLAQAADEEPGEEPLAEEPPDDTAVVVWHWYDEWDFRGHDYRPMWCRVGERSAAAAADTAFYDETLKRHHTLVAETRRQFELMRPESFQRVRRLEDGHEIDLDQAIEYLADRRAGIGPLARFYTRRDKVERDVSVAFLLDLSGSTDDPVASPGAATAPKGRRKRKDTDVPRVIDVEKEAAVLVVEALEAIGDTYALYGFSGYGRRNVEFHVVKDLDEPFDAGVRARIGALEPRRSTRMGPAIRHATEKLRQRDTKIRILILVSDGRPQDQAYGRDADDTDYAVHDTKQALIEARRAGIVPFLVTVDAEGDDYLREMCSDVGYEVVTDVTSLPRHLPALYRHLAT